MVDSATFVSSFYPSPDDYHSLYEVDGYSWYNGGRNLFDPTPISVGDTQKVVITNPTGSRESCLTVNVSAGGNNQIRILLNGKELGTLNVPILQYCSSLGRCERSATIRFRISGRSGYRHHTATER